MEGRGTQCLKPNTSCMPSTPGRAHCNAGTSQHNARRRRRFAQESDKCQSKTWHQPYGSCNDRPVEADLGRSGLCRQTSLADGEPQTALEAEKTALLKQLPRQKFETIADMTDRFVQHFTTLHLERVYTVGVDICAVCLAASRTLSRICEAVSKDPQGRRVALNNGKFMKLLVKLCKLESPGWPSICTVTDREMREFYEAQAHRKLHGTVSILEDEQSEELWKCIIGKAAESVRPLTYAIRVKGARVPVSSSCIWYKDRDEQPQERLMREPEAALRVNPFPVSDLKTLDVVRCVDARHLIVYCSSRGKESVDTLNSMLAEFHRVSTSVPREDPPNVGDIVGLLESKDCLLRMLVLEVAEEMAVVWSMDRGDFRRLHWNRLVDVLPSFRCLPPAVGLGVLPDMNAVPSLKLLRACVRTFQTLTDHSSHEASFHAAMMTRLKDYRAIEVLSSLLNCPDFDTRMITAKVLHQLCCRHMGRQAVSEVGCVDIVIGRLRNLANMRKRRVKNHHMITEEMLSLVILLQSMFFRNEELRLDYADSDHVALLSKIHHSLPSSCQLFQEIDYCLRTLLGPAYNKYRLPAGGKRVAMTPEKLADRRVSDVPCLVMQQYNEKNAAGRFYQRDSLVPFRCDETHELRPVHTMKIASGSTLAKVVCSFLNSWKPCIVYYGISREGLVHGVMLNHKERDSFRLGIDAMSRHLRPCLMPQSIDVKFVPVLRTPEDSRETVSRFVVEVKVRGAPDTVYTTSDGNCYLRDGGMSCQARTQDVRAWVAQQVEACYLQGHNLPLWDL